MTDKEEIIIESDKPQETFTQIVMALDYYSQWCEANDMHDKAEHSKAICKKYVHHNPEKALLLYGDFPMMPEELREALPEEYK